MNILKRKLASSAYCIIGISGIAYFSFWWFYRLHNLPGLHGDEAWSGSMGVQFLEYNISQVTGMNNYSGILQALLADFTFKYWGIGVLQLRAAGVFLNILAIIIFICNLSFPAWRSMMIFLVFLGQSALYLVSPRVAWEVNSLTLLFIVSIFATLRYMIRHRTQNNYGAIFLFLILNILGSYNHIIFSALPIAGLVSIILWSNYRKSSIYEPLILLFTVNALNIMIILLSMRYFSKSMIDHIGLFLLLIPIVVLAEILFLRNYRAPKKLCFLIYHVPRPVIMYILAICAITFLIIHGSAFFQVLCSYKILAIAYSYESSLAFRITLTVSAICVSYFLLKLIWTDLRYNKNKLPVFFLILYLGLLSIYTTGNAFRYYLGLYIILGLYIAYWFNYRNKSPVLFMAPMMLSMVIINFIQADIYSSGKRPVKAMRIKFGAANGTSAHFLPKQALIEELENNHIGYIKCKAVPFFILGPIKFYKQSKPWKELEQKTLTVGYDFDNYGTGFLLYVDEKDLSQRR